MRVNLVNFPSSRAFKVSCAVFAASSLTIVATSVYLPALAGALQIVRIVCLAIDGALLIAFALLIGYEQIQDHFLRVRWEREAGTAIVHGTNRECPGCGFARNKAYDRSCLVCGVRLSDVARSGRGGSGEGADHA